MARKHPDKPPVGQDWFDRYPAKFYNPDPPQPTACPICGDPGGNCVPEEDIHMAEPVYVPKPAARRTSVTASPVGPIVGTSPAPIPPMQRPNERPLPRKTAGPPVVVPEGFVAKADSENLIVATQNIEAAFIRTGSKRETTMQVFHRGEEMTIAAYETRLAGYRRSPTLRLIYK